MYKTSSFKLRMAPEELMEWRKAAGKMPLAEFVVESVDAAILGKVDHFKLNRQLRTIRSLLNGALDAETLGKSLSWVRLAKTSLNDLLDV